MIINYRKLNQQTIIYLLAMIYLSYDDYKSQKIAGCPDAQKLKRAYQTGLKYLSNDNRFYFDPWAVMRPTTPEEHEAGQEADRIFWETF